MAVFTVLDNDIAVNRVVADSKEDAELVTGLKCVEVEGPFGFQFFAETGEFRPVCSYPSWVWESGAWVAPVPKPENGEFFWNEQDQDWVEAVEVTGLVTGE
jgi:hypothetical protein